MRIAKSTFVTLGLPELYQRLSVQSKTTHEKKWPKNLKNYSPNAIDQEDNSRTMLSLDIIGLPRSSSRKKSISHPQTSGVWAAFLPSSSSANQITISKANLYSRPSHATPCLLVSMETKNPRKMMRISLH